MALLYREDRFRKLKKKRKDSPKFGVSGWFEDGRVSVFVLSTLDSIKLLSCVETFLTSPISSPISLFFFFVFVLNHKILIRNLSVVHIFLLTYVAVKIHQLKIYLSMDYSRVNPYKLSKK